VAPREAEPCLVLLVEDEEAVRDTTARALRRAGFHVRSAANGREALALWSALAEQGADVCAVVTDVVMPGLGGVGLARALRAERPTLPVLFVSGYAADALDPAMLDARTGYLEKPFGAPDLVARLGALLAAAPADA
jgi:two-component system cell cycle sensor histidine kinase/response regulator CckA